MTGPRFHFPAPSGSLLTTAAELDAAVGRAQQGIIDSEVRATRRSILSTIRRRLRTDPAALTSTDFLVLADLRTLHAAILFAVANVTGAAASELRSHDPTTHATRVVARRGLPASMHRRLTAAENWVQAGAASTSLPILIDDVAAEPRGPAVLIDAGVRALQIYPLHDDHGELSGLLSLYFDTVGPHPDHRGLARITEEALSYHETATVRPETADLLTIRPAGDVTVVTVHGGLDALTAPDLVDVVQHALAGPSAPHALVIDLREVEFVAVVGARALHDADEQCRRAGVQCAVLTGPDHYLRTVLTRVSGPDGLRFLDDVTELYDDGRA